MDDPWGSPWADDHATQAVAEEWAGDGRLASSTFRDATPDPWADSGDVPTPRDVEEFKILSPLALPSPAIRTSIERLDEVAREREESSSEATEKDEATTRDKLDESTTQDESLIVTEQDESMESNQITATEGLRNDAAQRITSNEEATSGNEQATEHNESSHEHTSSRPSSTPSDRDDRLSASTRTSLDEEVPAEPKQSSKVQGLVQMYNRMEKESSQEPEAREQSRSRPTTARQEDEDDFGDFEEGGDAESGEVVSTPDFTVDLSLIEELFSNATEPATPVPAAALTNTNIVSADERRAWYRISRYGSMRKHNSGDEDNYRTIKWKHSTVRDETLKIVGKWKQEERLNGKPGLPGSSKSLFGWGESPTSSIFSRSPSSTNGDWRHSLPPTPRISIDAPAKFGHSRASSESLNALGRPKSEKHQPPLPSPLRASMDLSRAEGAMQAVKKSVSDKRTSLNSFGWSQKGVSSTGLDTFANESMTDDIKWSKASKSSVKAALTPMADSFGWGEPSGSEIAKGVLPIDNLVWREPSALDSGKGTLSATGETFGWGERLSDPVKGTSSSQDHQGWDESTRPPIHAECFGPDQSSQAEPAKVISPTTNAFGWGQSFEPESTKGTTFSTGSLSWSSRDVPDRPTSIHVDISGWGQSPDAPHISITSSAAKARPAISHQPSLSLGNAQGISKTFGAAPIGLGVSTSTFQEKPRPLSLHALSHNGMDDAGWGDMVSSPVAHVAPVTASIPPASVPSAAAIQDDDDDWGDMIASPAVDISHQSQWGDLVASSTLRTGQEDLGPAILKPISGSHTVQSPSASQQDDWNSKTTDDWAIQSTSNSVKAPKASDFDSMFSSNLDDWDDDDDDDKAVTPGDFGNMVASPIEANVTADDLDDFFSPPAKTPKRSVTFDEILGATPENVGHRAPAPSPDMRKPKRSVTFDDIIPGTGAVSEPSDPWNNADFSVFETPKPPPPPPKKAARILGLSPQGVLRGGQKSRVEVEQDRIVKSIVQSLPDLSYMLRK